LRLQDRQDTVAFIAFDKLRMREVETARMIVSPPLDKLRMREI